MFPVIRPSTRKPKPRLSRFARIFSDWLTYEPILFQLGPEDLAAFARISTLGRDTVHGYQTIAFNINKHLLPYMPLPSLFRDVQLRTGTLIAGSHALRFFLRISDADTDLNIYVNRGHAYEVGQHLIDKQGYKFLPWGPTGPQLFGNQESDGRLWDEYGDVIGGDGQPLYSKQSIHAAFRFTKVCPDGVSRVISMSVAVHSAVHLILNMHTTCIMNLISSHFAISLYPRSTFLRRITVPLHCNTTTPDILLDVEREKYIGRGFSYHSSLNIADTITMFDAGTIRSIGDALCWKIPLETGSLSPSAHFTRSSAAYPEQFIYSNSWRLLGAGVWISLQYTVINLSSYRYGYLTVRPPDVRSIILFHMQQKKLRKSTYTTSSNTRVCWDAALPRIVKGDFKVSKSINEQACSLNESLNTAHNSLSLSNFSMDYDYENPATPWDLNILYFGELSSEKDMYRMMRSYEFLWRNNAYAGLTDADFDEI
ncbi:hypothetical protein HWV62_9297 [Athelia sp. TMB]|nr:hypothetical protein HWV62_9297 [Athelia sp. TMB]